MPITWGTGTGRKEERKEAERKEGPWTGPLENEKAPRGFLGAWLRGKPGYLVPFPARAESSMRMKHKRQIPRYPRTRRSGFMGSKALNDDSTLKLDHLRPVLEPLQRGLVL